MKGVEILADLHKTFDRILREYKDVYRKVWDTKVFKNELLTYFNTTVKEEVTKAVRIKNPDLLVDSSTGVGKTTKTPWIAILDNRITTKASEGTYIVYLFNKDEKSVYLTLEQSITEAKQRAKDKVMAGKNQTQVLNKLLNDEKQRVLNLINNGSFLTDINISTGKNDFDITAIMYKKYNVENLPENKTLEQDLHELIDIYEQYYKECVVKGKAQESNKKSIEQAPSKETEKNESLENENKEMRRIILDAEVVEVISDIYDYILSRGYVYSLEVIKDYYLSLKSKPFVILAGISGTGKTKLVKLFAEAIGAKYQMVSVRPDWSDSTDIFGYLNLDGKFVEGPVTGFIADANKHLEVPYILCLDEMNLARVEYYFSDFLSIIETRHFDGEHITTDIIMLDSAFGKDEEARKKYSNLILSENLYIVGTVNMDETTFPFSKKVLDRANTIEFSDVDMHLGLELNKDFEELQPLAVENSFMKSKYLKISACAAVKEDAVNAVIKMLSDANVSLKKINAQVAYRVRDEVSYYVTYSQMFKLMELKEALDNALLQKVLPRIQGSTMAIKDVLVSLFGISVGTTAAIIQKDDNDAGENMLKYLDEKNQDNEKKNKVDYPKSAEKIAFMMRRFENDGYTSYWL